MCSCIFAPIFSCWDTKVLVNGSEQVLVGFQLIGLFNLHRTGKFVNLSFRIPDLGKKGCEKQSLAAR